MTPTLLPAFCPERHINADGSFCLYWRAVDDIQSRCGGDETAIGASAYS
ncbi:E2 domain-containing protein [Mesorhizobium sp. M1163]